jgi:hypothetical protein
MSFLFEHMLYGCVRSVDDFITNNQVSFVTFNYDRTLEHFLCVRIANTYGIALPLAWESVKKIPIVHVYGSLGEFSPGLLHRRSGTFTPTEVLQAASTIQLGASRLPPSLGSAWTLLRADSCRHRGIDGAG